MTTIKDNDIDDDVDEDNERIGRRRRGRRWARKMAPSSHVCSLPRIWTARTTLKRVRVPYTCTYPYMHKREDIVRLG